MADDATVWFSFDSLEAAAAGLLAVMLDARSSSKNYTFGGLSASAVLASGLKLSGDISEVSEKVSSIPGTLRLGD